MIANTKPTLKFASNPNCAKPLLADSGFIYKHFLNNYIMESKERVLLRKFLIKDGFIMNHNLDNKALVEFTKNKQDFPLIYVSESVEVYFSIIHYYKILSSKHFLELYNDHKKMTSITC